MSKPLPPAMKGIITSGAVISSYQTLPRSHIITDLPAL